MQSRNHATSVSHVTTSYPRRGASLSRTALLTVMFALPWAAYAGPGETELISVPVDGEPANGFMTGASPDGRFIVFSTGGLTSPYKGIVKDRLTGTSKVIGSEFQGPISRNGRFIAFTSYARLVPADTNDESDIYVRDLQENRTILASVNANGVSGNAYSDSPVISANGRYVVFYSDSPTLVPNDTNHATDIFVRDLQAGVTTRASVSSTGVQIDNYGAFCPTISEDGRYVVFASASSKLVPNDTNGVDDVFLRDRVAGTTERISVRTGGGQMAEGGFTLCGAQATISPDGRFVTFGAGNVYLRHRQANTTHLVSVAPDGTAANGVSDEGTVSSNGRYVAFVSAASNLVSGDLNGQPDVFVRDMAIQKTFRVSVSSEGAPSDGQSFWSLITEDGSGVLFNSNARTLVADDTNVNRYWNVYWHENGINPNAPPFVVSPSPFDFGSATIVWTTALNATFTNTGTAPVSIDSLAMRGANPAQFAASHACGTSVAAGDACYISVKFTPASVGAKSALLDVSASNTVRTTELKGTGVLAEMSVSVTSIAFGSVAAGTQSTGRYVQVRNTGPGVLPLRRIAITGTNATEFTRKRWLPKYLLPGKVVNIWVWFQPTTTGAKTATLVISPGASGPAKKVSLTGTGT